MAFLPALEALAIDHVGFGARREDQRRDRRTPADAALINDRIGARPEPAARNKQGAVEAGSSTNEPYGPEMLTTSPTRSRWWTQMLVSPSSTRLTSSEINPPGRGAFAIEYDRGGSWR